MKSILIAFFFVLLSSNAESKIPLTSKNRKVYVTSNDLKVVSFGINDLDKHGSFSIVNDKNNADYIIDYKVKKTWMISFLSRNMKGYAQIINAKTGEIVFTSAKANSYWSFFGANHKKTIAKKLNRSIERAID
jgi:hypothetical protein